MKFLRNEHFNSKSKILAKISPRERKFWLLLYEEWSRDDLQTPQIPTREDLADNASLTLKKTRKFYLLRQYPKTCRNKILQQVNVAG